MQKIEIFKNSFGLNIREVTIIVNFSAIPLPVEKKTHCRERKILFLCTEISFLLSLF